MTRLLIVAGPVPVPDGVWNVEVPTEGLPERWRCRDCGKRGLTSEAKERRECWTPDGAWSGYHRRVPDGPFPATVAVWQEVECPACHGTAQVVRRHGGFTFCSRCDGARKVGAVVATVQVLGPTHHASHHWSARWEERYGPECESTLSGWHTPVGEVRLLDVPYPMEQPTGRPSGYAAWGNVYEGPPRRSFWWAVLPAEVTT